jgi:nitric oxide reductase large subunit
MRKHLPNIAIVVGALVAGVSLTYAIGRLAHLYLAGSPTATIKLAAAQVTLFCLVVVPVGLVTVAGGVIWKRADAADEEAIAAAWERKRQKRPKSRGGKFAR